MFDTVDPQEGATCLFHILGQAYSKMFDKQNTWREKEYMPEMVTRTHYSCLHEETTSAMDHMISQEMKRKLLYQRYEHTIRKWMKVKGRTQYYMSADLWDWIIPWKRSLTVEGCFSSKALTNLYTAKPFIIFFWHYRALKQMMRLQWLRISTHNTCGNSLLSEYLTIHLKRKRKKSKKTKQDNMTDLCFQWEDISNLTCFLRLVCSRQPTVFCIFCNCVFTTITGLKM